MFNPNIVQIIISVLIIKSRHKNIPTDDNLGDDVDGRESATIVMKTAIASSSVILDNVDEMLQHLLLQYKA
jgi:hypothetical protein